MHRASPRILFLSVALVALAALAPVTSAVAAGRPARCTELATDPRHGLLVNRAIKSVTSGIIPASGPNVAYCQVNLLYGESAEQNINIRVGLPLNFGGWRDGWG